MTRDERQEICRVKWIKSKCRGTLIQPTGCGKTVTAIKCIKSVLSKYSTFHVIIIVPTTALKEQWYNIIDNNNLLFNCEVLVVNTAIRHKYVCDLLVIDECHRIAADTFKNIFTTIKYRLILGLTATFERLDGKHELLKQYCPVIDEISIVEAQINGWISDYTEYQVLLDVKDIDIYNKYNKEFQEHYEFFNFDFNLAMSMIGKDSFINRAKYRDKLCPNGTTEERKKVFNNITFHATRFMKTIQLRKAFVNNHPKKLEIVRKIIEARPNSKIITFSNNIKMAESIGIGNVYSGKDSKKKGRITLEEFNSNSTGVLNSIAKLNEGADIKGLSVGIILGLDSSEIKAVQRRGRCIRFEKGKKAEIFNLIINNTIETKWFSNGHPDNRYITIDEEGLNAVLAGKEPKPYNKKIKNLTFRF